MPKRKTHEDFVLQIKNNFPNIGAVGTYTNNKTKIEFQCLTDGCFYKWMARPDNILSGYGCPECAKRKISILCTKSHEEFLEEVAIKNPGVKVLVITPLFRARLDAEDFRNSDDTLINEMTLKDYSLPQVEEL